MVLEDGFSELSSLENDLLQCAELFSKGSVNMELVSDTSWEKQLESDIP